MKTTLLILLAIVVCQISTAHAQQKPVEPSGIVQQVTQAAENLIATFDDAQKKQLMFAFDDQKQRKNWSNLPNGSFPRSGLRWGDLNQSQRKATMNLISATLSNRGLQQVVDNMAADEVLRTSGGRRSGRRGPDFGSDAFYISILGKPSTTEPWMWQFGGHHLAINATIVGDQITLAPSLTGGQPIDYVVDEKTVRQLAIEEDKSFEFVGSLTPQQLSKASLANRFGDLKFGPTAPSVSLKQEGINAAALDEAQQKLLLELISSRVGILNDFHTKQMMDEIAGNLDETWFAWSGPTSSDAAASYRIQSPTIMIELAPQNLGGDPTNHIHAMLRHPTNDYGADWIKAKD